MIAGGYDKHIPFDVLGPEICTHVKTLVLCGATAGKIRAAVENAPEYQKGTPEILEANNLREAVELAKKFGRDESPAFINGVLAKLVA